MKPFLRAFTLGAMTCIALTGCSKDVEKGPIEEQGLTQRYDDSELRSLISSMSSRMNVVESRSLDNLNILADLRSQNQLNAEKILELTRQMQSLQGVIDTQTKRIEESFKRNDAQDLVVAKLEKSVVAEIEKLKEVTNQKFKIAEQVVKDVYKRIEAIEGTGANLLSKIENRVKNVELKTSRLKMAKIDGFPSVVFEGVNVHIRNGAKQTTTVNGLGNLVIGYGERAQDLLSEDQNIAVVAPEEEIVSMEQLADMKAARSQGYVFNKYRVGSHNMVVGPYNEYTSYGAIINGVYNRMNAPFASILGGGFHVNNGIGSVIGGGYKLRSDKHIEFLAESYKWPSAAPVPVRVHPVVKQLPRPVQAVFQTAKPADVRLSADEDQAERDFASDEDIQ